MYRWTKKIHMYAGLFAFTALLVWGVAGVDSMFLPAPGEFQPPEVSRTLEIDFQAPGDLDDKALAARIDEALDLPIVGNPAQISRTPDANLVYRYYTVNGRRDVTFFEREGKVRVEFRQTPFWGYIGGMHAASTRRTPPDLPAKAWGLYNEISLWAFTFMTLSGLYLWLDTRPWLKWAQALAAIGVVLFIGLWVVTR